MGTIRSLYPTLDSEMFGHGKTRYFIDVKKACNDSHFLLITRSDRYGDNRYARRTIQVWEEGLFFFVEALSMVLTRLSHGEMPGENRQASPKPATGASGMKALPEAERPREKLVAQGAGTLSDAELLAILLGTGSDERSVLDLCSHVLHSTGSLVKIAALSVEELCRFRGIGIAKASTLLAAFELVARCQAKYAQDR